MDVSQKQQNLNSKIVKEFQTKIANFTFIFKQLKDSLLTIYTKFSSQLEQFSSQLYEYENIIPKQNVDITHDFTIKTIKNKSKQLSTQNKLLSRQKINIELTKKCFFPRVSEQNSKPIRLNLISYWKAESQQVIEKQLFEELKICQSPQNYDWRCKKHDKDILIVRQRIIQSNHLLK
ncbi:unnamed protein product [Paramecium octaurelia]|uniref:Uncharacterized protein n=1 Tax=Paramecium octaurelia TaxID=43137 RepID=A0A8S1WTE6_PAROT|nr:unnamed protein product [Paramecium octaurelia]